MKSGSFGLHPLVAAASLIGLSAIADVLASYWIIIYCPYREPTYLYPLGFIAAHLFAATFAQLGLLFEKRGLTVPFMVIQVVLCSFSMFQVFFTQITLLTHIWKFMAYEEMVHILALDIAVLFQSILIFGAFLGVFHAVLQAYRHLKDKEHKLPYVTPKAFQKADYEKMAEVQSLSVEALSG
ncbi:hypothetical protein L596_021390 [Steinernema carpocapsae]|uniref:Uncharacterized protein n=1 Tax=Steinernema carpocapsae TaxID=34508 RepID=A0A4U5MIK4_STECR|nr:hypothetical protein L596_021390 [Steinernema carpocapsae]